MMKEMLVLWSFVLDSNLSTELTVFVLESFSYSSNTILKFFR
ncbi:hypothetical protein LEP1GSC203_0331 [Leptospira terpstrae serovar Hualin str. LT 11-33 = ATCC 700639]|uniref:Uncharacterized protein n=1 Tax=Leptospira terpstrae serovar Hualin str. LT 11-33 = ATCC 700639 TaxID=1257025 RepID=N1VQC8_9LEPT|nr:hypothetical protein LEP1GSC203_0331 [Leptospira terpstrae serovar Hualin str. LT 11-33 = ATCC 700639]